MRTVQLGSPLLVAWSSFCNYVLMASPRNLSVQIFDGGELTAAFYGLRSIVSGGAGEGKGRDRSRRGGGSREGREEGVRRRRRRRRE